MSIWSPYKIEIMLHYHCSVGKFERWDAPIFLETVGELVSLGLLQPLDATPDQYFFTTTERGKALVEMWCSTPLPEMRFIDPRFPAETP